MFQVSDLEFDSEYVESQVSSVLKNMLSNVRKTNK